MSGAAAAGAQMAAALPGLAGVVDAPEAGGLAASTGPALHIRPNGPILVGDLHLTNAAELSALFGAARPHELVLAAYDTWGLDAMARLEGEFAFVLWDRERARLVAVRDRFGVRPIAYCETPEGLRFAADPAHLAQGGSDVDRAWAAEFLAGQVLSAERTAFAGIRRLPPGHMLIRERGGHYVRRWYDLAPRALPDGEGPEALRAALSEAVAARNTGATFLSGGLDSSSLTVLAAEHSPSPVTALSLRYPHMPELDEGRYIDAVRAGGNIDGRDVAARTGTVLDDPSALLDEQGAPVLAPNIANSRQVIAAAAGIGAVSVLDGHGGDEVIGHGAWVMSDLAAQGRWAEVWTLCRQRAAFDGDASAWSLMAPLLRAYGPGPLRAAMSRLGRGGARPLGWRVLVDEGLATDTDLVARANATMTEAHVHLPEEQRIHARLAINPGTGTGFEILNRTAAAHGTELRMPFYDRNVVEICLGQPSAAKLRGGMRRALLRNAMAGLLPDTVRLRPDKVDFMPSILEGMRRDPTGRLAAYRRGLPPHLEGYVDPAGLAEVMAAFDSGRDRAGAMLKLVPLHQFDHWIARREGASLDAPPRKKD